MSELSDLRKQWRAARLEYPGWVTTPDNNREQLWIHTRYWIPTIAKGLDQLPAPENLLLLYELNWRLERALWPLFLDGVQQITTVLETFAILPRVFDLPSALYRPTIPKFQDWDWKELGFCWLELAFAVTREAREDLDATRHQMWLERLQSFAALNPVTAARIHYEKALFRLWELDFRGLRETLSSWPAMPEQPFWEAKRAALLAEAGNLDEAISVSERALVLLR